MVERVVLDADKDVKGATKPEGVESVDRKIKEEFQIHRVIGK